MVALKDPPFISAMRDDVKNFLRQCALKYARTTTENKRWLMEPFVEYCEKTGTDYRCASTDFISVFLLNRNVCRKRILDTCNSIRQLYAFSGIAMSEIPVPSTIRNGPVMPRQLPKLPGQKAMERVYRHVNGWTPELSLRNRLIVELAYGSGLRRMEIVSLNIEDIDFSGKSAMVTGKGSAMRVCPLTEKAIDLIKEYLVLVNIKSGPLLLSQWTRGRLTPAALSKIVKYATGYNTHAFRHACATHMLENGCNLRYVQALLGHVKITTTQIYTHVDKKALRTVIKHSHPRSRSRQISQEQDQE